MNADELYRPELHFTPAKNWINDPNGLVWHKGEYHLFFQHNPFGRDWGNMSWGHAVSTDLMHWQELPVAIAEDEDGAIFSGSAVSIGDEIVAIYTNNKDKIQTQCIATSSDKGRTFKKHPANPVLDLQMEHFRDPKVFRYHDHWIMALVKPHEFLVCFYSSFDLINWALLSEFGSAGVEGVQWECPDIFSLQFAGEELWVLIVSISSNSVSGGSGTQYFIGDFDGITFTPRYSTLEARWLDYGPDNYAAITYNNEPNGKRILIGWMSNWNKGQNKPNTSWTGAMTIPRELGLTKSKSEIVLTQKPICSPTHEIKVKAPISGRVGLKGFAEIGYDADKKVIFINDFEAPFEIQNGQLHLLLVIDRSSIELFSGDGTRVITVALFPEAGISREFVAFAD